MTAVDVAALADLEDGVPSLARAGRREVVLVRWNGEVFALRNVCPHQTQSFVGGHARPTVVRGDAAPGCFHIDQNNAVLMCPLHGWTFDVRTGMCTADESYRVKSYPATVVDGRILVDIDTA